MVAAPQAAVVHVRPIRDAHQRHRDIFIVCLGLDELLERLGGVVEAARPERHAPQATVVLLDVDPVRLIGVPVLLEWFRFRAVELQPDDELGRAPPAAVDAERFVELADGLADERVGR